MHGLQSDASTSFFRFHVLGRRQPTFLASSASRRLVFLLNSRTSPFIEARCVSTRAHLLANLRCHFAEFPRAPSFETFVEIYVPTRVGLSTVTFERWLFPEQCGSRHSTKHFLTRHPMLLQPFRKPTPLRLTPSRLTLHLHSHHCHSPLYMDGKRSSICSPHDRLNPRHSSPEGNEHLVLTHGTRGFRIPFLTHRLCLSASP